MLHFEKDYLYLVLLSCFLGFVVVILPYHFDMSGLQPKLWFKLSTYCALTVGLGYTLMQITTPSREQIMEEFSKAHQQNLLHDKHFKRETLNTIKILPEHLRKNAQSTRPIWQVESLSEEEVNRLLNSTEKISNTTNDLNNSNTNYSPRSLPSS